jgi:hypothetical protein
MTVAMVSPFFILKFPFFVLGLYRFLRKFFPGIAKIFRSQNFCRGITRIAGITYGCKTPALRRPESFLGTARAVSWVPVEDSLNPDFS